MAESVEEQVARLTGQAATEVTSSDSPAGGDAVDRQVARLLGGKPKANDSPAGGDAVDRQVARLLGGKPKAKASAPIAPPAESIGLENFLDIIPGYRQFDDAVLDTGAEAIRDITRMDRQPGTPQGIASPLSELIPGMMDPIPSHEISLPTQNLPEMPTLSGLADLLLSEDNRTPYTKGKAYQQHQAERKPTTIDLGVLANAATGLPGTIAETAVEFPGEFAAQMFGSAGENVALPFMGKAVPAIGKTAGMLGDALTPNFMAGGRKVGSSLAKVFAHRGGYDPAAVHAFDEYDMGQVRAGHAQEDMAGLFTDPLTGRPMNAKERHFTAMLATQPEQRMVLEQIEAIPAQINRPQQSAFSLAAQELPATPGSQTAAAAYQFPETNLPMKSFAQRANQVAEMWGFNKGKLSEFAQKNPQEWTRFNDDNYFPEAYANRQLSSLPSVPMRERTNFMAKRRDINAAERVNLDSTDPVQRAYDRMGDQRRLINTHNLFNELAINPDVVYRPGMMPEDALIMNESTGASMWRGPNKYVKMSPEPSLGALANQWVKAEEAAEINSLSSRPGQLRQIMNTWWSGWKYGNTILNPKTHIRNMTSNVMMAHAEGLSPHRIDVYKAALKDVQEGGKMWQEARDGAAPWTTKTRRSVLSEVMSDRDLDAGGDAQVAWMTALPRWMMSNKPSKAMAEAYEDSEALFKQAVYRYKRELGMESAQAIREADRSIINYGKMPQWVKKVRAFPGGVPFISFTYGATPLIAETALTKPQLFLRYKIFADSWNELAMEKTNATPEERAQFDVLYPGSIAMLANDRDASGSLKVFDAVRNTPVADFMPNRYDLPGVPTILSNLLAKSPLVTGAAGLFSGTDPITKVQFSPKEVPGARVGAKLLKKPLSDKASAFLFDNPEKEATQSDYEFLFNLLAANPVKGSVRVGKAALGKPNILGEQKKVPDALWAEIFGPIRSMNKDRNRALSALEKQEAIANWVAGKQAFRGD